MRKVSWVIALCVLILVGTFRFWRTSENAHEDPVNEPVNTAGSGLELVGPKIPSSFRVRRHEIRLPRQSTLRDVLAEQGFTAQGIHRLIQQTKDIYDLNRVKAGHRFALEQLPDGGVRKLEYDIDDTNYLVVRHDGEVYQAEIHERIFETTVRQVAGRIRNSLWNTLISVGERPQLVMSIHELMQWDIDFTAIQPDDTFKLIFEELSQEGEFVKYGDIQAMEFSHGGRTFYAFRFFDADSGKVQYYDQEGKNVRKAFLKVPLRYDYRISSGFSYSRLHPVTKRRVPHYGVDYAAPRGTPVLASASGRVIFASWNGGSGQMVKLRHPNGYTTYYLHLSKILVKAGKSVGQGDRIGLVGSTGLATGSHLDYRIQDRRGRFINPKKYVALPSDKGVSPDQMPEFRNLCDNYLEQLRAIAKPRSYPDKAATAG